MTVPLTSNDRYSESNADEVVEDMPEKAYNPQNNQENVSVKEEIKEEYHPEEVVKKKKKRTKVRKEENSTEQAVGDQINSSSKQSDR